MCGCVPMCGGVHSTCTYLQGPEADIHSLPWSLSTLYTESKAHFAASLLTSLLRRFYSLPYKCTRDSWWAATPTLLFPGLDSESPTLSPTLAQKVLYSLSHLPSPKMLISLLSYFFRQIKQWQQYFWLFVYSPQRSLSIDRTALLPTSLFSFRVPCLFHPLPFAVSLTLGNFFFFESHSDEYFCLITSRYFHSLLKGKYNVLLLIYY